MLATLTRPLAAQKMATPAGEAPGPWILGTVGVGKGDDPKIPKTTALKGIAIEVGEKGEAAVAYDLDLCRMAGAWTGKFTTPMNLMSRGDYPTAMGNVAFTTVALPGFASGDTATSMEGPWTDSRPEPFGPLPPGQPRFKGFHTSGGKVILKWDTAEAEVLEMPGYEDVAGVKFFTRTFEVRLRSGGLRIDLGEQPGKLGEAEEAGQPVNSESGKFLKTGLAITKNFHTADRVSSVVMQTDGKGISMPEVRERLGIEVEVGIKRKPIENPSRFRVCYWNGTDRTQLAAFSDAVRTYMSAVPIAELSNLATGGPAHGPEPVSTAGDVSTKQDEAYVVDTIKLPDPNPWGSPMFIGGFDFFPDGRAAVCTFHGDVFIVSGIDAKLEKVTWRRFASGLYHPLGLKIVNGEIYVTCRDGIWRLKDLNGDGECDFYEAFNYDLKVTKSFHEFVFDLQTDPQGNFYFAKAGPVKNGGRGFDEIMAQHGTLMRVSHDGAKLDVVATGFRAPNGIGCGPDGQLTTGDNEGTWTPACKINWIKPGGFYGVVPLAHRDPPPTDYDRPLCWMPKRVDNSSGSQVWVTSDKWGPWKDQLLHLSYGTCSVLGVLREEVSGANVPSALSPRPATVQQGGVVRFPLNFQSGIMRARFNPADGQLYVAGLRGWQTTGVKNGAFQRVRYTGAPVRMPIGLHATKRGVRLDFACALDPASANDPQNWNVEVWNYVWSSAYGSPEISTLETAEKPGELGKDGEPQYTRAQAAQKKHDPLTVKSATVSEDAKSVFLEIPEIKPVMQMSIKFGLKTADGADLRSEVINTIHALGD